MIKRVFQSQYYMEINLKPKKVVESYLRGNRGMTSQSNVKQSFIRAKLTNKSVVQTFLIVFACTQKSLKDNSVGLTTYLRVPAIGRGVITWRLL